MSNKPWFRVVDRNDNLAEVVIFDEIGSGGASAADLLNQLNALKTRPILLRINSPGGSVFDGYAIYSALGRHAPGVQVQIEGLAASIASYIAMVGKPVRMMDNAMMMIHKPTCIVGGTADDMRRAQEMLERCTDSLVSAYATKTGLPAEKIATMLDAETWMTATEAKDLGFVDEITPSLQAAAHLDVSSLEAMLAAAKTPSARAAVVARVKTMLRRPEPVAKREVVADLAAEMERTTDPAGRAAIATRFKLAAKAGLLVK